MEEYIEERVIDYELYTTLESGEEAVFVCEVFVQYTYPRGMYSRFAEEEDTKPEMSIEVNPYSCMMGEEIDELEEVALGEALDVMGMDLQDLHTNVGDFCSELF